MAIYLDLLPSIAAEENIYLHSKTEGTTSSRFKIVVP